LKPFRVLIFIISFRS